MHLTRRETLATGRRTATQMLRTKPVYEVSWLHEELGKKKAGA